MRSFIFVLLSLMLASACAGADDPSQYLMGGRDYIPDAEYGATLCHDPRFVCRKVQPEQTWWYLFPDDKQREMVMRLNRTNVALRYRTFIIVPKVLKNTTLQSLSPFPRHHDTHGHKLLYVDLGIFAFAAYDEQGDLVRWGPATGGKPWCPDTRQDCATAFGDYRVFKIKGADCQSGTYPISSKGGAPMPYCMYYHKGFAIHGSTLSGFVNRSRGCVRLFDEDAKWLHTHFVHLGTEVIVKP